MGYGRALSADGHFSFTADIGVAFTGSPDIALDVTCAADNALVCSRLYDSAAAEEAELQKDADEYDYWPVVSFGVSYRF